MLKIRLRRMGAKFQPTYRVVVADSRAPRDGAFVSILGFYNPRTDPPTITIDEDALRDWVRKGAQPTDSVLSLLQTAGLAADLRERFRMRVRGAGGAYGGAQAGDAAGATTGGSVPRSVTTGGAPTSVIASDATSTPVADPVMPIAETTAPDETPEPLPAVTES
jgi:small subunit ribosomal protein S16